MKINICILNMEVRICAGARKVKFANCVCRCGNSFSARYGDIRGGKTKSCGCYRREVTGTKLRTHGYASLNGKSQTYLVWVAMRERCRNKKLVGYKNYGGRGILVDKRWARFEDFLKDMGECPKGRSLDRIDNNKGYAPENCRWATRAQQNRNTRQNRWVEFQGERMVLSDLAKKINMSLQTLHTRLRKGWSIEKAATTPVRI